MVLAALLAACQDSFGQNLDRIRISKRVFPQDLPRNHGKMYDCQNFQTRRHRNYRTFLLSPRIPCKEIITFAPRTPKT